MDDVAIGGDPDSRQLNELASLFDAPAYVRRARGVHDALETLLGRCRDQRDKWLLMPRIRLGTLHALRRLLRCAIAVARRAGGGGRPRGDRGADRPPTARRAGTHGFGARVAPGARSARREPDSLQRPLGRPPGEARPTAGQRPAREVQPVLRHREGVFAAVGSACAAGVRGAAAPERRGSIRAPAAVASTATQVVTSASATCDDSRSLRRRILPRKLRGNSATTSIWRGRFCLPRCRAQ